MKAIRQRLTYANVISTLALFLVLCGGVAIAAKVGRKSVGAPQLKANAVTTAKIKANAVTTRKIKRNAVSNAKIRAEAVTGEKIADKAVTGEKIDVDTTPFSRVVHRARGSATLAVSEELKVYPLGEASYTQGAHENDSFIGAVDLSFAASCTQPRGASAALLLDPVDPLVPTEYETVARGVVEDTGAGSHSARIELGPDQEELTPTRFEPGSPKAHKLTLVIVGNCTGGGSGITATFGAANVIGTE